MVALGNISIASAVIVDEILLSDDYDALPGAANLRKFSDVIMSRVGLGHNELVLGVEPAIFQGGADPDTIEIIISDPDDALTTYTFTGAALTAKNASLPDQQYFYADYDAAGVTESRRYVSLFHSFAIRGDHRLTARFTFGTRIMTSPTSIRIGAGDGLTEYAEIPA